MENNYTTWMQQEQEWMNSAQKKAKRNLLLYFILIPVIVAAAAGLIAILASGKLPHFLSNLKWGFLFGLACDVIMLVILPRTLFAKKLMKSLEKEVEQQLTGAGREEFFAQMLRNAPGLKEFSWKPWDKEGMRVLVNKDFLYYISPPNTAMIINLAQVERIAIDVDEFTWTTRSSGYRVRQTSYTYPMQFFYKSMDGAERKDYDRQIVFYTREARQQVLDSLKKTEEQSF